MSNISGVTIPRAVHNIEELYGKLLSSAVKNASRTDSTKVHNASSIVRAELIHQANVRTRAFITMNNVSVQQDLTQGPRKVMEEKNQEKQTVSNQVLSKIANKLTSLFSRNNFLAQGTHQLGSSTTVSDPALANQNVYPITGNIAAATQTNSAISLQAGETPAEAAINMINLSPLKLDEHLPSALSQSVETFNKVSATMAHRPINASLL